MPSDGAVIVVGYDGSRASDAALDLALARAAGGGKLFVVHAYEAPADYMGAPYYEVMLDAAAQHARTLIERLQADGRLAGVDWEPEVIAGPAARSLADVARVRDADEIVLGTRGVGRVRALLGSVAHELLHLADRPVTVIPERMLGDRGEAAA